MLIKLKVKENKPISLDKNKQKLHYGTGENRVDFEMDLTEKEIKKMDELRQQDPVQWLNNDLELVKAAKQAIQEEDINSRETIIHDNILEQETQINDTNPKSDRGNEVKISPHWLRQNGTEMCISIDDATYQQMVKMQKENPQKWVDKEFDLLQAIKSKKIDNVNNSKAPKHHGAIKKSKIIKWTAACLAAMILYGIIASTVDHTIATYNSAEMINFYQNLKKYDLTTCNYETFKYKMIANSLYRKKMYNYKFYNIDYDDFIERFEIKKRLENPFVWIW